MKIDSPLLKPPYCLPKAEHISFLRFLSESEKEAFMHFIAFRSMGEIDTNVSYVDLARACSADLVLSLVILSSFSFVDFTAEKAERRGTVHLADNLCLL